MKKYYFVITLVIVLLSSCTFEAVDELIPPSLLTYETDTEYPLVIDYSFAGYKQGTEKPSWKDNDLPHIFVDSLGAVPDDGKDDIDAIQAAVDSAGKMGGAIVRFSKGRYDFDVNTKERFVKIPYSNVIMLGAGEGPDGTTLYDHTPSQTPVPGKMWLAGVYPSFFSVSPVDLLDEFVPGDGKMIEIASLEKGDKEQTFLDIKEARGLSEDKVYLLTMSTPDRSLLSDLIYPLEKAGENYEDLVGSSVYKVRQLIEIKKIEKNRIYLETPVIWNIKDNYEIKLWEFPVEFIRNTAIVGFHMETAWHEEFYHHKNSIHDNGWDHIKFNMCNDCYAYALIHENPSTAFAVLNSLQCSFFECRIKGNTGHNGFIVGGYSTRNLLHNLKGGKAFHTFGISGYSSGNVFYNCYSEEPSSIDCHGGLTVYNLFDNIYGSSWVHGGSSRNLPPAHAQRLTIWNWKTGMTEPYKGRIKQTIAGFKETPGFFFVGISGMYGQPLFMPDNEKELLTEDYSGEWGNLLNFRDEPPIPSLYMFQRSQRINEEFIIR